MHVSVGVLADRISIKTRDDGAAFNPLIAESPDTEAKLEDRPKALFRFKGFVGHDGCSAWEVHCVGPSVSVKPLKGPRETQVVGIGLAERLTQGELTAWWDA